jgi:1,4-alpha-glucan branching enzyme
MQQLFGTLTNRRAHEKHVAYCESHDQALVGDKTIAFWLMDADMYWYMSRDKQSLVIDRGIALHKMIRLVTFSLGGEAYLNFIGNEFGHPEWVDFPRVGNNNSYHYARRQWSLVDNPNLRYKDLATFDREMIALDEHYNLLSDPLIQPIHIFDDQKLMVFRRGPLVFVFNWHPSMSYTDYRIGVPDPRDYKLILNTDDLWFGGHGLVVTNQHYPVQPKPMHARNQSIQLYIPARSAQVLAPV